MDPEKQNTVNQLRRLAQSARGQSQNLLSLDDEAIYQIFHQLQNGSGNRSTARFIRERHRIGGSENSLQQSIGKLKKKIEPLLRNAPVKLPQADLKEKIEEANSLPMERKLATLAQIEADYRDLINSAIFKSKEAGILSADLHKHITALANLTKTRTQLEKDSSANPGRPQSFYESEEAQKIMQKRSDIVLKHYIGDDGPKMVKAAHAFLEELSKKCITMNLNPETGEYELVKPYKKSE